MNIVFLGSTKFGLRCLQLVMSFRGLRVTGVVTAPKRVPISYRPEGMTNVLHADIASYSRENNLPCIVMRNSMANETLFAQLKAWAPDIFLVVGWYHLLPKKVLELAPAYGLHASLLPDYSGGAPLVWAMINGEKRTGITFFQFDDGVDSGPVIGQKAATIKEDDTISTLYARIEDLGLGLLRDHLPSLAEGTAKLSPQDEAKRRVFPQRSPEDGEIDWNKSAYEIYNFIRAQTKPYFGAFTMLDGAKITIWKANKAFLKVERDPGEVVKDQGKVYIQTGRGVIRLKSIEYNGNVYENEEISTVVEDGVIMGS